MSIHKFHGLAKAVGTLAAFSLCVGVFSTPTTSFAAPATKDSQPKASIAPHSALVEEDTILNTTVASLTGKPSVVSNHRDGRVDITVSLRDLAGNTPLARLQALDALATKWSKAYGLRINRKFSHLLNGFSATIPGSQLQAFAREPELLNVHRTRLYYPQDQSSRELQQVEQLVKAGLDGHGGVGGNSGAKIDGRGMVVSIIDSGIDPRHQDLGLEGWDRTAPANNQNCPAYVKLTNIKSTTYKASGDYAGLGFTCKVPNGYNYADGNDLILDTGQSHMHGQHVAGIVAANGLVNKDGTLNSSTAQLESLERVLGVAPNAQLLAMKVFSNEGQSGAREDDIVAAIEDSVKLGADIINMSIGATNGFNDKTSAEYLAIEAARRAGVLTLVAASNSGQQWKGAGNNSDGTTANRIDDSTIGSPGTHTPAFTVSSVNSQYSYGVTAYAGKTKEEAEANAKNHTGAISYLQATGELPSEPLKVRPISEDAERIGKSSREYAPEFILDMPADNEEEETAQINALKEYWKDSVALVQRGEIPFADKFEVAFGDEVGAKGIIIYNNPENGNSPAGMAGVDDFKQFGASIGNADGEKLISMAEENVEVDHEGDNFGFVWVKFTKGNVATPLEEALQPSDFTSWGPTPELDFKPEIAGIGGHVWSLANVQGGVHEYKDNSGTSMATPNVAGLSALLLQAFKTTLPQLTGEERLDFAKAALMNTAQILTDKRDTSVDKNGVSWAPRQIGSGLAQIKDAVNTRVFAFAEQDGRREPSKALRKVKGATSFEITLVNKGNEPFKFDASKQLVINESNESADPDSPKTLTTHYVNDETATVTPANGTVPANGQLQVRVDIKPNLERPLHYLEGHVVFKSVDSSGQPDLHVPYLGLVEKSNEADELPNLALPIYSADKKSDKPPLDNRPDYVTTLHKGSEGEIVLPVEVATARKIPTSPWVGKDPDSRKGACRVYPKLALLRNLETVRYEIVVKDPASGELKVIKTIGIENNLQRPDPNSTEWEAAKKESFAWDCKLTDPQTGTEKPAANGEYFYRISSRNTKDSTYQHVDLPFQVDLEDPILQITKPPQLEGDKLVINAKVSDSLSGVAPDEGATVHGLAGLKVYTDGTSGDIARKEITCQANGECVISTTRGKDIAYVLILATDNAGNISKEIVYAPDYRFAILNSSNFTKRIGTNSSVYDEKTKTVKVLALTPAEAVKARAVVVDKDGQSKTIDLDIVPADGGFVLNVPIEKEYINKVTLSVYDKDGKQLGKSQNLQVEFDPEPPVLELISPPEGQKAKADPKTGKITVTGKVSDVYLQKYYAKENDPNSGTNNPDDEESSKSTLILRANFFDDVNINPDGTFTYTFTPSENQTALLLTASDQTYLTSKRVEFDAPAGSNPDATLKGEVEGHNATIETLPFVGLTVMEVLANNPDYRCGEKGERACENGEKPTFFLLKGNHYPAPDKLVFSDDSRVDAPDGDPNHAKWVTHEYVATLKADKSGDFEVLLPFYPSLHTFKVSAQASGKDFAPLNIYSFMSTDLGANLLIDEPTLINGKIHLRGAEPQDLPVRGAIRGHGQSYTVVINGDAVVSYSPTPAAPAELSNKEFTHVVPGVKNGDYLNIKIDSGYPQSAKAQIVIDNKNPVLDFGTVKDGTQLQNSDSVTLSANDENLDLVEIWVDGKPVEKFSNQAEREQFAVLFARQREKDPEAHEYPAQQSEYKHSLALQNLTPGKHQILLHATDYAGNATTKLVEIEVLAPAPLPPAPGGDGTDNKVTSLVRFPGSDRVETSLLAWQALGASTMYLAGVGAEIDALAGAPLAAANGSSVVFNSPHALDSRIAQAITSRHIKQVVLLGGTGSLSPAVVQQLQALGVKTERFGGTDRYATAELIAKAVAAYHHTDVAHLPTVWTDGLGYADAVLAGPVAHKLHGAVLLVRKLELQPGALPQLGGSAVAVGGQACQAIEANKAKIPGGSTCLVGKDRFETSVLLAKQYFADAPAMALANGFSLPDALSAGSFISAHQGGVLLAQKDALPASVKAWIGHYNRLFIFGGTGTLSERLQASLQTSKQ